MFSSQLNQKLATFHCYKTISYLTPIAFLYVFLLIYSLLELASTVANNGFQLAEIQLYSIQNVNTSTPYYLKSVYYFHVNTTISILPIGLHDSCSFSSLDLPSNLTLSSTTGEISGALDTIQQYLFTVVIIDSSQQILDQLTFDLHIVGICFFVIYSYLDCSSPSYSQLVISKQNEDLYSLERIQLYDAEEGLLFDSIYSPVLLEQQWSICLPSSIYTLTLSAETEAGWGASSFLSISLIRERTYQLLQYSLSQQSKTLQMNTQYIIDSHITSWYYTAYSSTIPDSWYSSAYQPDDQWSIFDYSSLHIIRHNVYLFKISVPLPNLNAYRSWEFSINIISGVIIYINSYEIYRLNMNYQALTPTSVPLHVDEAYVWRTIVGNLVTLSNSESLSISIALIYPSSFLYTAPLLLDATFRFLTETKEISLIHVHNANIICYDHDEESEAHNCSSILHFQSPSSYVSTPIGLSSNKTIDIRFNHQNSYAINYYCLTNGQLEPQSDPMNWNIYGIDGTNNTVLVGFVTNSYWTTRLQKKCFFLQNITPYVGLRFVFFYSSYYSSLYSSHPISISHMEFYVDFLSHYPMAPLTVLPSNFEVLSGLDFPPMTFSHSHFYSLSISPSLPGELFFDSSTGIIFGKSSGLLESTTYTLQGSSFVGSMLITTLTIRIVYCTSPSILLSIRFDIKAESTTYSWYLMDQDQNDLIVYKNEHNVPSNTVVLYSFCLAPSVYSLILEDDDGLGWNQSEYSVFFSDQTILAEGVISSTTPKRIPLDISSFIMYPKTQQWYYWSLASSPPMNWNVLENPYSPWIPSYPSSLPFLSFTTQYYLTSFVISSIEDKYSAIEITVNNYAGMVLYLNGIEIGRIHLPNGSVSYSTLATEEYEDYRPFTVTIPSQYSYIHIGTNYLAVEIHSLSAIPAINRFDSKMIYIPNHSYRVLDGNCTSSSLSGYNTKVYHVFDNDITTEYITSTVCSNTTIEWMYNNQRFEYINQYRIINGKDCNTRTPSSWMLEGWVPSDNEWVLLHQVAHERFTQYNQRKTYSFVTNRSFNRIRYTVTECRNPSIQDSVTCNTDVRLFQLSEIQFLVSNLQSICSSVDGFPSALNGEYSYKLCSQGYTGTMKRLCQNSQFQEILDECVLLEPSLLQYDTNYTLYNNYEYQISPLVQGAELSFLIHPSLPVSLSFNSSTGEISGVPTLSIPRTRYIVQCWNSKGSLTTELYITVIDAYCEEDGVWPVTIAGETQVSLCSDPINYEGQITRRCLNTTPPRWDSVLHNCIVKYPQLIYTPNSIYGFKGLPILTLVPVIYGVGILRIYPVSQFPQGIYLDPQTGAVYGTPATEDRRALIIAIENTRGTTQVQVTIFISVLVCLQDNEWGTTEHSTTVYMNCTNDQLGVQSRSCEATSHYSVSWSTADYSHCFTYESLYQYSDNNLLYHFDVFLYGIDLSDYCNPICMETIRSTLEVFLQLGVAVDSQLYSISSQQRNASVAVHYCFHISKTSRLLVKEQLIELFRNKSVLLEKLADYQSLPIGKIYDIELDDDSIFYNLNRYSNTVILLLVVGSFIVNFVICMLIVLYYCAYYHKYKMKVKNVYQPKGEFSGLNH